MRALLRGAWALVILCAVASLAFAQVNSGGVTSPTGPAGGGLTGSYPNPTVSVVGPGGSSLSNGIVVYSASLTPVATAATVQATSQAFNPAGFSGLSTSDKVYVNGPAPNALCPMTGFRVSATGTLQLDFITLSAVACTPTAGTYTVIAIR